MKADAQRRRCLIGAAAAALAMIVRAEAAPRVITVVARKFEFVPARIALKKGEPVVLELSAPEVLMGFACSELGLRSDIVPGQVSRLRFTPDKVGEFAFACDIFCGSGHEKMDGVIVVQA